MPLILLKASEKLNAQSFQLQQQIASAGVAASSGGSCPADGSPSLSTTGSADGPIIGFDNSTFYGGQSSWTDGGTPRTICKVGFSLGVGGGSISAKTYTAYIFASPAGAIVPASPLATSAGVTGSNSWSQTMVRFTFGTPFLTTANVAYSIVVATTAVSAANYAQQYQTASSQITGYVDDWSNLGACSQCSGSVDCVMEIYWQ